MWKNNHKSSESSNYPTKCPKLLLSEFQSAKTLKKLKARRTNLAWSLLYKLQVSATTSLGGTQWEAQQPPLLLNPDRPQALLNTCTPSWPPQMGRETPQQVLSSHKVFAFNNYLPLITTALDLYIKKYLPLLYRQELTSVKKKSYNKPGLSFKKSQCNRVPACHGMSQLWFTAGQSPQKHKVSEFTLLALVLVVLFSCNSTNLPQPSSAGDTSCMDW